MKKKNIYNLLVDFRNTKDSSPMPINIALTSKDEADKFVKESKLGFHRIYEKITILETAESIITYLDTLLDATIFTKAAEVGSGKKSGLYQYRYGVPRFTNDPYGSKMHHMYLLSDEEIMVGDWCIKPTFGLDQIIIQSGEECYFSSSNVSKGSVTTPWKRNLGDRLKKIVATTDNKMNIPIIGSEFVQEFIESKGKITKVKYKIVKVNLNTYKGLIDIAVIYKK